MPVSAFGQSFSSRSQSSPYTRSKLQTRANTNHLQERSRSESLVPVVMLVLALVLMGTFMPARGWMGVWADGQMDGRNLPLDLDGSGRTGVAGPGGVASRVETGAIYLRLPAK